VDGCENYFPNTIASFLKETRFQKLLDVVGEEFMTKLVEKTWLFYKCDNRNWIQLTGCPIADLEKVGNKMGHNATKMLLVLTKELLRHKNPLVYRVLWKP
jgi:hypothetical protein